MSLLLAGIDEAGYGPVLGPLSVAMTLFRVEGWEPGQPAPDLWKLCKAGVCRKPADTRKRIAVDDSKKLKLPNDSPDHHPLLHLEGGVLAFLAAARSQADGWWVPATDAELFEAVGCGVEPHAWYAGQAQPAPVAVARDQVGIRANMVRRGLSQGRTSVLALRCEVVGEERFNRVLDEHGTKAAATAAAVRAHLRYVWDLAARHDPVPGGPRVVCDRQGGRTDYTGFLQEAFPEAEVVEEERSAPRCRYHVREARTGREMSVLFMPEAESRHLPVALASMLAKLVRELLMGRFNRYWCGLLPELKPTAGYRGDAWRWLREAAPVITPETRRVLVRRA
ncbi:MAG TPA: hypothetical protein VD963_00165 [Phycisphaerales bacterium]|nr:hypothetical protein [Phycisphaerales bacterium]